MAARNPTPDMVNTLDDWLRYRKRKAANVIVGHDGALLVLDPAITDKAAALESAKRIEFTKGYDAIAVLANPHSSSELRAAAQNTLAAARAAQQQKVDAAVAAFQNTEREMLEATEQWKIADPSTRATFARQVGARMYACAEADTYMRETEYPYRSIVDDVNLTRMMIDYASMDERKLLHEMHRGVPTTFGISERAFVYPSTTEEGTA